MPRYLAGKRVEVRGDVVRRPAIPVAIAAKHLREVVLLRGADDECKQTSGDVPPAVPIFEVQLGVDFRVPKLRGWEARLEGGFYDAFYLGGGIGYTF